MEPSKRLTEIVSLLVRLDPKASALKIKCLLYMLNLYWLQHNNELAFGDKMYKFPLLYFSCKNEYVDDWELVNLDANGNVGFHLFKDNSKISCLSYEETKDKDLIYVCKRFVEVFNDVSSLDLVSFIIKLNVNNDLIEEVNWYAITFKDLFNLR